MTPQLPDSGMGYGQHPTRTQAEDLARSCEADQQHRAAVDDVLAAARGIGPPTPAQLRRLRDGLTRLDRRDRR